jgi:hypothetical protein
MALFIRQQTRVTHSKRSRRFEMQCHTYCYFAEIEYAGPRAGPSWSRGWPATASGAQFAKDIERIYAEGA